MKILNLEIGLFLFKIEKINLFYMLFQCKKLNNFLQEKHEKNLKKLIRFNIFISTGSLSCYQNFHFSLPENSFKFK